MIKRTRSRLLTSSVFLLVFFVGMYGMAQANPGISLPLASKSKSKFKTKKHKRAKARSGYRFKFYTCDSYSRQTLNKKAERFSRYIHNASKETRVSAALIKAVITAESCFRPASRSGKGAVGLMQLMPATAKRFGVINRYNNANNIKAGARYLRFLLKRYKGDLRKTIAAYNAGEGTVDRFNGIPPYRETRLYVKRVMNAYNKIAGKKKRSNQRKRLRKERKQDTQKDFMIKKKDKAPQQNNHAPKRVRFVNIHQERLDLAAVRTLLYID